MAYQIYLQWDLQRLFAWSRSSSLLTPFLSACWKLACWLEATRETAWSIPPFLYLWLEVQKLEIAVRMIFPFETIKNPTLLIYFMCKLQTQIPTLHKKELSNRLPRHCHQLQWLWLSWPWDLEARRAWWKHDVHDVFGLLEDPDEWTQENHWFKYQKCLRTSFAVLERFQHSDHQTLM